MLPLKHWNRIGSQHRYKVHRNLYHEGNNGIKTSLPHTSNNLNYPFNYIRTFTLLFTRTHKGICTNQTGTELNTMTGTDG